MTPSKQILVTGATGQQGGSVTRALLARGHRVRGLTRNPVSEKAKQLVQQGVELAVGDFQHFESLVDAAKGVDAIFFMTTPFEQGVDAETEQGLVMTRAALEAGARHLIYSSVASANQHTGIPHFDSKYAVEQAIEASGLPYTIVAPVFFMENLLQPWMSPGLPDGQLSMAMPGTVPLQQIAVSDIGSFVASIVERGERVHGKRYDIAGDELTNDEIASLLQNILGRDFTYTGFPPDVLREHSEDMALMFEWFISTGYQTPIDRLHAEFAEVGWQRFEPWARKQNWIPDSN